MKKVALLTLIALAGTTFNSSAQNKKTTTDPIVGNPAREINTIDPNKGDFLWDKLGFGKTTTLGVFIKRGDRTKRQKAIPQKAH